MFKAAALFSALVAALVLGIGLALGHADWAWSWTELGNASRTGALILAVASAALGHAWYVSLSRVPWGPGPAMRGRAMAGLFAIIAGSAVVAATVIVGGAVVFGGHGGHGAAPAFLGLLLPVLGAVLLGIGVGAAVGAATATVIAVPVSCLVVYLMIAAVPAVSHGSTVDLLSMDPQTIAFPVGRNLAMGLFWGGLGALAFAIACLTGAAGRRRATGGLAATIVAAFALSAVIPDVVIDQGTVDCSAAGAGSPTRVCLMPERAASSAAATRSMAALAGTVEAAGGVTLPAVWSETTRAPAIGVPRAGWVPSASPADWTSGVPARRAVAGVVLACLDGDAFTTKADAEWADRVVVAGQTGDAKATRALTTASEWPKAARTGWVCSGGDHLPPADVAPTEG